mmetsp:Transcript_10910/g.14629  ORF Transcript_10910/g.14629 Transcript_10910/m.14629 type:complete len:143 (+) Transcript_10910:55-483(+)
MLMPRVDSGMVLAAVLAATAGTAAAFQVNSFIPRQRLSTSLKMATVDPDVVTKKEYQDVCGVQFDGQALDQRLQRTSYLYPKHVEVIEDFSPIVDEMVDNIVSRDLVTCFGTYEEGPMTPKHKPFPPAVEAVFTRRLKPEEQ